MEIRTHGVASFKGNSYPKVELIKTLAIFEDEEKLEFKEGDREQTENIKMGEIICKVKIVDCKIL